MMVGTFALLLLDVVSVGALIVSMIGLLLIAGITFVRVINGRQSDESIARMFHEQYERLAPEFGYETRTESAVPWEQVPEPNRRLMIAVAGLVRRRFG